MPLLEKINQTKEYIQSRAPFTPQIGLILGSGLGSIAEQMTETLSLSYSEIPHFYKTSIEGHAGKIVFGKMNGIPTVVLQGRFHFYEGHSIQDTSFPTRVLCSLGIQFLILTNAAGAVNPNFKPGDLMIIEDHINLLGANPLIGPNSSHLGPRFPDMTEAYSRAGNTLLKNTANELNILFQTGIYAALPGPSYETPAEVRMLRTLGADAVGMSTVPETLVARHMNIPVVAMSCITNLGAGLSPHPLNHHEVVENSQLCVEKIKNLIFNSAKNLVTERK